MGKQHSKRRSMTIKIKQKRKAKLAKLRKKYMDAKFEGDKEKILEKVFKITPWLTKEEFLKPIKKSSLTKTSEK